METFGDSEMVTVSEQHAKVTRFTAVTCILLSLGAA
jgi:hypothetical protein